MTGLAFQMEKRQDHTGVDLDERADQDVSDVDRSAISISSSSQWTNQDQLLEENGTKNEKADETLQRGGVEAVAGGDDELNSTKIDLAETSEDVQHLGPRYYTPQIFTGVPSTSAYRQ